jgi:hypothetical protein
MSSSGVKISKTIVIFMPAFAVLIGLNGCASFGEGVARALIKQGPSEDTRQCYVRGTAFDGVEQMVEKEEEKGPEDGGDLKVLMVHGIGTHLPGYSTRLAENLARELNLDVVDREPKIITLRLQPPELKEHREAVEQRGIMRGQAGDKNGTVSVNLYQNKAGDRKMIFYELTWSEITDADKKIIAYDDSGEYTFRRAELNKELKHFINNYLPDPLIYLGGAQYNIQQAVTQTLCYMFTRDYQELPKQTDQACHFDQYPPDEVRKDSYVFISHSLGSRILTDSWQMVTAGLVMQEKLPGASPNVAQWRDALREKTMTIFMLSNQLPLLQLGREAPAVTHQSKEYCTAGGAKYGERVFSQTNIISFSDPNDILSWAVPPDYANNNMDSRMCPNLVNVIINIAEVKSILGLEMAAPGEAHRGYDNDSRVIKLIARGMSEDKADPMVKDRCEWMEFR